MFAAARLAARLIDRRVDVLALENALGVARTGSAVGPAPVTPTRASVQTPSSSRVITAATPTTA